MFDELRELDAVIVDDVKNAELVADESAGISWRLREVQGGGAADVHSAKDGSCSWLSTSTVRLRTDAEKTIK